MLKSWLRRWLGIEQVFNSVVQLQKDVQHLENEAAGLDFRLNGIEADLHFPTN